MLKNLVDFSICQCYTNCSYFLRNHTNVHQLDLLHAQDYSGLNPFELSKKMQEKKNEDLSLQKNML